MQTEPKKVNVNKMDIATIDSDILAKHAMLISVSIGQLSINRKDKKLSSDMLEKYGIDKQDKNFVRGYKTLYNPEHFKPMVKRVNAFRTFIYENTLPYDDTGKRLLPVKNFEKVNDEIREFASDFETLKQDIVNNIKNWENEAVQTLNGLYNPDDYFDAWKVERKYYYNTDFAPVPAAGNFHAEISQKYAESIKDNIEANSKKTLQIAMSNCWQRIFDSVQSLNVKMQEKKKDKQGQDTSPVFRNSIIGNIQSLVELLPSLNITNDPKLESMRLRLQNELAGIDVETLRDNDHYRKDVADKSQKILDDLAGIF